MPDWIGPPIDDHALLRQLPAYLVTDLRATNGFLTASGGLHIRGACMRPSWHSLRYAWQGAGSLHQLFPALLEADIPLAQDCFGDQFLLRNDEIVRLRGETGDVEHMRLTWPEFMANVERDPIEFLDLQPLQRFLESGGILQPGQLLSVYPPFITRQAKEGNLALRPIPSDERIAFLADFARQIRGVQDGQQIRVFTQPPE